MRALMCFLSVGALLWPQGASAQLQPYRAEYALRLGTAVNAPRVGSAVQDLSLTCEGWHLRRDVKGEIALSATWKLNVASKLDGEEPVAGDSFRYRTVQIQNGAERETHGKVQRAGNEWKAEIVSESGPAHSLLPSPTLMPVALIGRVIERLRGGPAAAFPALAFDAEGTGETFRINITPVNASTLRGRRPADKAVEVPGKSWAAQMSFTPGHKPDEKPLFTIRAQVFDSGVLDRVTVDAPMATVTADLQSLEMRQPPTCPPSPVSAKGF